MRTAQSKGGYGGAGRKNRRGRESPDLDFIYARRVCDVTVTHVIVIGRSGARTMDSFPKCGLTRVRWFRTQIGCIWDVGRGENQGVRERVRQEAFQFRWPEMANRW